MFASLMFASRFLQTTGQSIVAATIGWLFRWLNNRAAPPTIAFAVEYKFDLPVEFAVGFAVRFLVCPADNSAIVFLVRSAVLSRIDSAVDSWDCLRESR